MYGKEQLLLTFDLSTITIGWSVFSLEKKQLVHMDYWKYKKEEMLDKAEEMEFFIDNLLAKYNIKYFCIEERLKSFRAGGTNAEAMGKTAALNFFCQTVFHKKQIAIKEINVNTARKLAFPNFHSIARKIKDKKQKEVAFEYAIKEVGEEKFPTKVMKSGSRKGKTVFLEEARDIADAFILGKACLLLLNSI